MHRIHSAGFRGIGALLIAGALCSSLQADSNWPGWRGPRGDGHSDESGLPETWGPSDISWKVALPGRGQSSPVIWGERIFLTSALDKGKQRIVFCLNRADGAMLWEKVAWTGVPEPSHQMNGWASATCATDGERVYAFFGHGGGLFCYSIEGDLLWSHELGEFAGPWGTSACPVLVGDLVVQNCDADADAQIVAYHKKTGELAWRTKRENYRGWSTPLVLKAGGKSELVLNGHTGVRAYDAADGKEVWYCRGFNGRGEPTITPGAPGLLFAVNGLAGDIYAIRPGGAGAVTDTHMAWHTPRKTGRDTPSPVAVGAFLTVTSLQGIATCYDSTTGKQLWQQRMEGNFSASPIAYQGLALFLDEAGQTVVIKPGPEYELVGRNSVGGSPDEIFRASIAPSAGQLFIRSDQTLYCVGARRPAAKN